MTVYDIGDLVKVSTQVTVAGVPTDATMAIAISAPDGSTPGAPVISHDGVGLYSASLPVAMAGNYVVKWTASGAAVGVDEYQIFVQPAGTKIVGLGETKAHLNIAGTSQDNELLGFIDAAGEVIEAICGPTLNKTVVESFDGGDETIALRQWPIVSITSVKETWWGNATYNLTEVDITTGPFNGFQFTFDPQSGTITRRNGGFVQCFMDGTDNITVTYVKGRAQPWKANIRLAALELVGWFWRSSQIGRGFPRAQVGGQATTLIAGYAVPNPIVEALLKGDQQPPLIGA